MTELRVRDVLISEISNRRRASVTADLGPPA